MYVRALTPAPVSTKSFIAIVVGNALEFFDFGVYAFFAVMIGKVFFPVSSPTGQLLLSFSAFGMGFVMRPVGAMMIGSYADRVGRRAALTSTILLMALGTAIIAVTPSFASIGVAAPIAIVVARLVQGFSAGGEVGVATSYLVEVAPTGKRGVFGSLQAATQSVASIAGAGMGFALSLVMSDAALAQWGFRVPFALGIAIAPVGLYIRKQLPETADVEHAPRTNLLVIKALFTSKSARPMVLCALGIIGPTITTYVLMQYMTSYAMTVLAMPTSISMLVSVASGCAALGGALLGGWASDFYGRRTVMIWPRLIMLLAAAPIFSVIFASRTSFALLSGVSLLTFLHAVSATPLIVALSESFPRKVRSLGVGFVYAVSVTIFGGSASATATWLVAFTHSPIAPAWYLVGSNLVSVIAVGFLKLPKPHEALD